MTVESDIQTQAELVDERTAFTLLPQLASETDSRERFLRVSVHTIADHFGGHFAAGVFTVGAFSISEATIPGEAGEWSRVARDALTTAESRGRGLARAYATSDGERFVGVIAAPLPKLGETSGAVVVYCACDDRTDLEAQLTELRSLVALMAGLLDGLGASASGGPAIVDVASQITRADDYASIHELAFALTNGLCAKLACDQVSLGWNTRGRLRLLAISGLDDTKARPPGAAVMRSAMEECLDLGRPICVQAEDPWRDDTVSQPHRLHQAWHEVSGRASVASVPLLAGDECVGVLSLRRRADNAFTFDELTRVSDLVTPFAPSLVVVRRASRSALRHALESFRAWLTAFARPASWGRRVLALALMAFVTWVALGTLPFRVTVPAVLAPKRVIHLSAPYEGRLARVHAEPGALLSAGDPVYELDTTEHRLHLSELTAEAAALRVEADVALAAGDIGEAEVARARLGVVTARMHAAEQRIAAAVVSAPMDGAVLSGDLTKLVGQAVRQGDAVVEFSPGHELRAEMAIPEWAVDHLRVGVPAAFASSANPRVRHDLSVETVAPAAEVRDGRNVFVARAHAGMGNDALRAGMEGNALVTMGRKPVWWLLTHKVADFVSLRFWF
jgi:multidrug efflux pump subunit AcrA (membrane-fusion protein)